MEWPEWEMSGPTSQNDRFESKNPIFIPCTFLPSYIIMVNGPIGYLTFQVLVYIDKNPVLSQIR